MFWCNNGNFLRHFTCQNPNPIFIPPVGKKLLKRIEQVENKLKIFKIILKFFKIT